MSKIEDTYNKIISETRLTKDPNSHDLTLTGTIVFKWTNGGDAAFFVMGDNQIPIHLQNSLDEALRPYENKIITVRCFVDYNTIIIKEIMTYQY